MWLLLSNCCRIRECVCSGRRRFTSDIVLCCPTIIVSIYYLAPLVNKSSVLCLSSRHGYLGIFRRLDFALPVFMGNIARSDCLFRLGGGEQGDGCWKQDLKISVHELEPRMFQIVYGSAKRNHFDMDMKTGVLFVNDRIDHEEFCERSQRCVLNVEAIAQSPHSLHQIEINILDINDNSPKFLDSTLAINIAEDASPGDRFHLPVAV